MLGDRSELRRVRVSVILARRLPGITLPFHTFERALEFSREFCFHQHSVAPDVEDIQRYIRGVPGMPEKIQQQASYALRAIQSRTKQ